MNDSSLCATEAGSRALERDGNEKAKLERHLEEVVRMQLQEPRIVALRQGKRSRNKAKKSNVNTELKYYVAKAN